MNRDVERILYSEKQIAEAVKSLGERITRDYAGKIPVLLGILKGSSIFHADLMRAIDLPCEIDFLSAKSYGMGAQSSGKLRILKEPDIDIRNRDVIIVEDILDTAVTLSALLHTLSLKEPASLKTAVFLDKNIGIEKPVKADYKCFDAENEFLVGYGLDYAEKYRNLPYIGILKREIYS
ncbi:MAG: hypoxanthine phosphoribosyltransferase [Oscillospiraceae bacterium]|jgi:hypoxanthine phosphoribosyltransferase|nr:hypoxanthine phosphoribosyltransferase [Oscillospiraceae bacterium]